MRYTIQNSKAQKRVGFIDIPGFLKDYAGVISAIVALTNLYFVSQVFKFNRRMSQSKLSISHDLLKYDGFIMIGEGRSKGAQNVSAIDKTYLLENLTNIEPRSGLPSSYLTRKEEMKALIVNIKNNGDLPSTNVKVDLVFQTYGTINFYPKDDEEFRDLLPRELFSEHKISIKIPYIGAEQEMNFQICKLHGQFRETELHLVKVRANGFDYIKPNILKNFFSREDSKITLNHYKCLILNIARFSEFDLKILYGLPIDDENS